MSILHTEKYYVLQNLMSSHVNIFNIYIIFYNHDFEPTLCHYITVSDVKTKDVIDVMS